MEQFFYNWEAVQFYLYAAGITKSTIFSKDKQYDVSILEHFNITDEYFLSQVVTTFNSVAVKTKEELENFLVSWEGKKFTTGTLPEGFRSIDEIDKDGLYYMKRTEGNTCGFDILTFIKPKNENCKVILPIEVKYSKSTKTKLGADAIVQKLNAMKIYGQSYPLLVFVLQRNTVGTMCIENQNKLKGITGELIYPF